MVKVSTRHILGVINMNSDKIKKIILGLSIILSLIMFFCLYLTSNLNKALGENNEEVDSLNKSNDNKDTRLIENKHIYDSLAIADLTKVYINVFSTMDNEGTSFDFSSFDLMSEWDLTSKPVLDANVRFVSKDRNVGEAHANIPNATIRVRRNPSASLKSYRVKLMGGFDGLHGQAVFNIDKNLNDPSRIANKLAHDLIKGLDHIAGFRTNFLHVYIRDDSLTDEERAFHSYGLYTHKEQPNKRYLRVHGLDENGSLYKAEDFRFKLTTELKNVDDSEYNEEAFESVLAIREGKDHTKLISMLEDINDENKNFKEVFSTYFNEDNYLTWLAVNILLGNVDSMNKGFLLYNPSDSSVFYFLAWDFDNIFSWMDDDIEQNIYEEISQVDLHRKYLEDSENLEKLKLKMDELIVDSFSPKTIKMYIKHYKPVLLEMMDKYPDKILSTKQINEYMAYIGQVDERVYQNYLDFIGWYEGR